MSDLKINKMIQNGFSINKTETGYIVYENCLSKDWSSHNCFSFHNKETLIDFLIEILPQSDSARETTPFSREFLG